MKVSDLVGAMEDIAPTRFCEDWDNVGLLVGDPGRALERVLVAIDATPGVLAEAAAAGPNAALVAYHPPVFAPQRRFLAGSPAFEAARLGLAVYSPHTALDAARGGTNDVLADLLGMAARRPLRPGRAAATLKLVTFVPADRADALGEALFEAGAGRIGRYVACSFRAPGTGTFFGEDGTHPAVGAPGRLERVEEVRFETIVPEAVVGDVVAALRRAHPYEEPAFDLVPLAPEPLAVGMGRVGEIEGASARAVVDRVKLALGVEHVAVAGPLDRTVARAAVCAGSGGELLGDAIAAGAALFLTGELRHHDALRAEQAGVVVVCTRHSVGERAALPALAQALAERLPGVGVAQSRADREPFAFV